MAGESDGNFEQQSIFAIQSPSLSAKAWHYNAIIHHKGGVDDWYPYCEGYKRAADRLVETVKETELDFFLFPVAFLYRHYVEIRLKELFVLSGRLLNKEQDFETTHGLNLWHEVRVRILNVWPDTISDSESMTCLKACDEIISWFETIDPKSFAFRYPVDKRGGSSLANTSHINLHDLWQKMQGVSTILDGSSYGLDDQLQAKYEMLAEQHQWKLEMLADEQQYYERDE